MASLVNKDSYLQRLAKKICAQEVHEPQKRKFGTALGDDGTQPKKKKKRKKVKIQGKTAGAPPGKRRTPGGSQTSPAKSANTNAKKSGPVIQVAPSVSGSVTAGSGSVTAGTKGDRSQNGVSGGDQSAARSFSAMNLLRQRLHEKIQEVSGQGSTKELSPAVLEKRQRRKYEKERKKRRRKELRMKEKMEKEAEEASVAGAILEPQAPKKDAKAEIVFNKVEVHAEGLSKAEKRRAKRQALKGNITPLTGKNYKQLLCRLESRQSKLEELKDKDEEKAKELEAKMKWTNVLYKAEGVKIRDDEDRLKAALKRKEKHKAQRQKQWEKRTEQVVEKMQQRQDKRRKNLQKKKVAKVERKKAKARKKGRILPGDLEKAGFK
ncbi:surfeit locus protein 6 [Rhineura floridana]|uniref:surfeit locus protein 6 n=1 Tax=Rhineura floridana TaxID=261503 RepID=UPI002AC8290A|nr:surfeit locus protein 6 [Rhineura floridana]XP_061460338.1 surfeit locus protein 6 [Rhineura floridana]